MIQMPGINVLLAMSDVAHVHHDICRAWFRQASPLGWALCPLTVSGLFRVAGRPGGSGFSNFQEIADFLEGLIQNNLRTYSFWSDAVSLFDAKLFDLEKLQGYRQITDLHLLGIALLNGGTLVTLDTGIPQTLNAIRRPTPHLLRGH